MPDLFGRTDQVFGGGLSSDAAWMWWENLANAGLGLLITNMQMQYAQPVRRIFELGPYATNISSGLPVYGQPVYYVAGRPEGNMSLSRIVGPAGLLSGFYHVYGNPCNPNNNLTFRSTLGCLSGNGSNINPGGALGRARTAAWVMRGVVLTNVAMAATAQEMMVSEQASAMFVGLNLQIWNGSTFVDVSTISGGNTGTGLFPVEGPLAS